MRSKDTVRSNSASRRIATRFMSGSMHVARRCSSGGLVEEVKRILAMGYPEQAKPFESHGYKQVLQMLHGELKEKEAFFTHSEIRGAMPSARSRGSGRSATSYGCAASARTKLSLDLRSAGPRILTRV